MLLALQVPCSRCRNHSASCTFPHTFALLHYWRRHFCVPLSPNGKVGALVSVQLMSLNKKKFPGEIRIVLFYCSSCPKRINTWPNCFHWEMRSLRGGIHSDRYFFHFMVNHKITYWDTRLARNYAVVFEWISWLLLFGPTQSQPPQSRSNLTLAQKMIHVDDSVRAERAQGLLLAPCHKCNK